VFTFFILCLLALLFATVGEVGGEGTIPVPATGGEPGKNVADAPNGGLPTPVTGEATTYTQADYDALAAKLRNEIRQEFQRKSDADIKAAKDAAEKQRLEEQGHFKQLYEDEKAKREAAEAEGAKTRREILCARIAAEAKLPADFATRLQGETEDEIRADAEALAKAIPAPAIPRVDVGGGGNGTQKGVTDEERNRAARHYATRF
jgi:hypothetical protein